MAIINYTATHAN